MNEPKVQGTRTSGRGRRFATVAVFGVAVWAVAATSSSYTQLPVAPVTSMLRLDDDHPVALARVRVQLNSEATAAYGQPRFSLQVDGTRQPGPGGPSGTDQGVATPTVRTAAPTTAGAELPPSTAQGAVLPTAHFTVMAAVPDAGDPDPRTSGTAPERWQAEATLGVPVDLPVVCRVGPCERAFWLIAQLDPGATGALDVDWHVDGSLRYGGDYPNDADATITIDPSVLVAGPAPAISASTEPETIVIGPGSPAAARVIELGIGAEALGPTSGAGSGSNQVAALSVDVRYGSTSGRPANTETVVVGVVPLDQAAGEPSSASPPLNDANPSPMPDGADPFVGCPPDEACTRRFLVTFAWTGRDPKDEELVWTATVRRTDLLRVWMVPARLSADVIRRIDLADGAPEIAHVEGDVSPTTSDRGPQVQLRLASRTTSEDPLAALLPLPATYTYRARLPGPAPSAPPVDRTTVSITTVVPDIGTNSIYGTFEDGSVEVQSGLATPTGACRLGEACPDLSIGVSYAGSNGQTPPPGVTYHWTLDIAVRSYLDVPVTLEVVGGP